MFLGRDFFWGVEMYMFLILQIHLSWKSAFPINVSLNLNKQWENNSSRGQACALFSTQQVAGPLMLMQLIVVHL